MFYIGQRWYSEGEPELGLGIIVQTESKRIELHFPLASESRIYSTQGSPLKRFVLQVEDKLLTDENVELIIDDVKENEDQLFYLCGDQIIPERNLSPKLDLGGPLHRLIAKNFDTANFFKLRYQSYLERRHYQGFNFKGFLGAKIRLIPHQVYVVNEVLSMPSPKAMLCDEVGLGKTIEASLILNSLIQKELVTNVLIVVPDSLVNQWFIELYKKFSLSFHTLNSETIDFDLDTAQRLIVSSNLLQNDPGYLKLLEEKSWDMLVIDESHQFNFANLDSGTVKLFNSINKKTYSSILLSATPEVLGVENLFNQLHFLDPNKYTDFKSFSDLISESQNISKLLKRSNLRDQFELFDRYFSEDEFKTFTSDEELKQTLIDRFGTGRSYFRNSRKNLENFNRLFNERLLNTYPIKIDSKITDRIVLKNKTNIVFEIISKFREAKILILCHSKAVVLKLHKELLELDNFKLATFHSDQSLMERDRQAAYFADEEGAQVLISTEIGSEGRNFEFSNHLILFDLPKLPDQLEQRIGRLDRIGQKNDINIHIPYVKKTFEEILFRWYHEVFSSFTSSPKGANAYYQKHQTSLKSLLESNFDEEQLNVFLDDMKSEYKTYSLDLENGRDLVIETHSYNDNSAKKIINEIKSYEEKNSPAQYIDEVCNAVGISNDELNDYTYFLKPNDTMLIPSFPGLTSEGVSVTYDRDYSLKFDNINLMNWEHPISKGCFELLLSSPLGNMSVIKQDSLPRNLYFEFIILLQCSDEFKHKSSLYLPFTPLRVLLNASSEDCTKKYPKKFIDEIQQNLTTGEDEILHQLPKSSLVELFSKAHEISKLKAKQYQDVASKEILLSSEHEKNRISNLAINTEAKQILLNELKDSTTSIVSSVYDAKLAIDSVRVILPSD